MSIYAPLNKSPSLNTLGFCSTHLHFLLLFYTYTCIIFCLFVCVYLFIVLFDFFRFYITYAVKYVKSKGGVTCRHGVTRYKQRQTVVNVLVKNADRNGMLAFDCFFARATFLTIAAQKPNKNKAKNNHNEAEQTGENKASAPVILKKDSAMLRAVLIISLTCEKLTSLCDASIPISVLSP